MTILDRFGVTVLITAILGGLAPRAGRADERLALQTRGQSAGNEPIEYVSPEVARLEFWYGVWRVTERHFNAKGETVATVKGTERIEWLLDRRAIRRDYSTTTDTTTFRALGILTWNDVEKMYNGVWFDNVSTTGPATVKGVWDRKNRAMTFKVESLGEDGSPIKYEVVEQLQDEQTRVATTYLIGGKGKIKRMEVEYKRSRPCPARVRPIFDN